jgi:NADH-quinone oxidoreductase subunit J
MWQKAVVSMIDYIFYLFSFLMVFAGLMVITLKNPVHAVLFLIFTFFNAAGLFILIGAEFIAMILIIVYVGAVAVLFLFVIMMLDINIAALRQGFYKYLPLGVALGFFIFLEIYIAVSRSTDSIPDPKVASAFDLTNTEALGKILYTDYIFSFQAAGLILLIAMIGAIVLTLTHSRDAKRQDIYRQVSRRPEETIQIVKVKSGQGVKI